ncbi:hypothetical protein HAV22_29630 [Massilia sp. TW-1]|uniref:Lipoprotein n=1 Tax=Telluria antibiotica TaxID=2717319 RepID=A0ABX0PMP6_9BURK|nr:hypothetical protein [Telluria antibiotica]NIA57794.1 hypothetical protein [Telluria antibiotica]
MPSLLLALCGACAALSGCADMATRRLAELQATLVSLPPECTLGNAADAPGVWISASQAAPAPNIPASMIFTFNEAVRTDAFRVALNPSALEHLDKVESSDAQGNWSIAWTGVRPGTPAGCAAVKLAQTFTSGQHEITALRITLRRPLVGIGRMDVANASVLKAG